LARIKQIPGIADARVQQSFQQPTLSVSVDRSLASLVGISEKDAATAMQTTLSGSSQTSPTYWLNPRTGVSYPVSIQTPPRILGTINGLKNIPLTTSSGADPQLLGGLATIQRISSNAVVSHYNVRPVIDIYATPQGRDLGGVATDIRQVMQKTAHEMPNGASVSLRGQVTTMTSAYQQLYVGLAFAVVLIYLLIVINFQSWLDPFVIVIALPTALAGIVWILFASNTTLSVPALTGAIMCMGIATANSILVISFARERLAAGADAVAAAIEAGSTRFRPVLMTALAMIIGMLPMAIEPGQNAPLGRAVIGGLLFATCATLFLVPTMFSVVHAHDRMSTGAAPVHPHEAQA
jgi:multidrug efflux pump subunit AcrB